MTSTVRTFRQLTLAGICGVIGISLGACRCDEQPGAALETDSEVGKAKQANLLSFPEQLHVEDAAVNDFVIQAMNTCAGGDYQAFRLLWSAREEPLPRSEFEQGWQAVQEIRILALQQVMLAPGSDSDADALRGVYAVLAEVRLDPTHPAAQGNPHREVVLMIVREHDAWRLGRAPQSMRDWIKERTGQGTPVEKAPASEPAGDNAPG